MNLDDCKTTTERDVVVTYRRHLRRKNATPFSAAGSALAEEIGYGAVLTPEFVDRFTDGTRTIEDGRVRLTPKGRRVLEVEAGIGQEPNRWHHWTETPAGYVKTACGLVRSGLKRGEESPPPGADVCEVCAYVAEHGHHAPVIVEVQ